MSFRPGGTADNSPAIYRWEGKHKECHLRPGGTADNSPAIYRWEGEHKELHFVPEGRLTIAQRFIAGKESTKNFISSRRDGRKQASPFNRPSGTEQLAGLLVSPAINRWAIVGCPYGTNGTSIASFFPAINRWAIVRRPCGTTAARRHLD